MHESDKLAVTVCEDDEILALLIDGQLTGESHTRVVRHLAICRACRETVAAASSAITASSAAKEVSPRRPIRFRSRWTAAAASLAVAASLLIAVSLEWWPFHVASPLDELIAAAGPSRPVDGRLAGFAYGMTSATRGPSDASSDWQVLAAAARIKTIATDKPTAENLHALGIAHLVLGDDDAAVRSLEDAAAKAANDGRIHSDLSAAYSARARRRDDPSDFAQALAAADRAVRADSRLAEAYFNRAVALESLSMQEKAREAWRAYIGMDPSGPWAAEARDRLDRIVGAVPPPFPSAQARLDKALVDADEATARAIVDLYPLPTHEYLSELLSRWAAEILAGADGSTQLLAARRLVQAARHRTSDRTAVQMLARIDAAAGSRARLRRLAVVHRTYTQGTQLLRADRVADAERTFSQCARTSHDSHPVELECALHATTGTLNSGARDSARPMLFQIADVAEHEAYLDLLGLVRWRLALFTAMDGDLTGALVEYRRALTAFREAGVTDHEANVYSLMSEILRMVGDVREAWRQHQAALRASSRLWSPRIRHQILVQALLTSLDTELPEVALTFADALIAEDRAWGHQSSLALAYAHRARALAALGRRDEAIDVLGVARQTIASVPDEDYRRRFNTDLLAAEIEVYGAEHPRRVLAAAQQGLDNVLYARSAPRVSTFLFARATARSGLGQIDEAEADYTASLAALEVERDRLAPDLVRISHMERSFAKVRTFAEFELTKRQSPTRALAVLEQSRARWLLSAVRGVEERPIAPTAVVPKIPAETAVVFYALLGRSVDVWVLTDQGVSHRRLPTSTSALTTSVRSFSDRLAAGDDVSERLAALHQQLVAPLHDAIGPRTHLIIVPDGPLYDVPFAALLDKATGRYLIEDATVSLSPSLTLASVQPTAAAGMAARTVSVGIFGGNSAASPFLPEVEMEQKAISAIYSPRMARRYGGDNQEFLDNLDRHDVVHFTGHAVANIADPAMARLEFPSPDGLPVRAVLASQIASLRLRRVRVVVLAACRTASGSEVSGEGALSLAHAFLGAGVGAVLGTLWDVNDHSTRVLVTWVHEQMAEGSPPAEALRRAQVRALRSADASLRRPLHWAAFVATARN